MALRFKRQLACVRGRAALSAELSTSSSSQGWLISVRTSPCLVHMYSWDRHLCTYRLPSDPTCLRVVMGTKEDCSLFIGCRSGKVYRASLEPRKEAAVSRCRSSSARRLSDEDVWFRHSGIRLLASSSAGLVACGDMEPSKLYSMTEPWCQIAELSALDNEEHPITSLSCVEWSPERAQLFGAQEALLQAPVAIAGRKDGSIGWHSLSCGGGRPGSGSLRCGDGAGGAAVVGVVEATTIQGGALVAVMESGHVAILRARRRPGRRHATSSSDCHCEEMVVVRLPGGVVRGVSRQGEGLVYLAHGQVYSARFDALLFHASSPVPTPLSTPIISCPTDVVALTASVHGLVLLTKRGRLMGLAHPSGFPSQGAPPLPAPVVLECLERSCEKTRALEDQSTQLGLELERLSTALALLEAGETAITYSIEIKPEEGEQGTGLVVVHIINTGPDILPLGGWALLISMRGEQRPSLVLMARTAGVPPTLEHTSSIPLRDLAASASLTFTVPLDHLPSLARLRIRLTLQRPSSPFLRPSLHAGWNDACRRRGGGGEESYRCGISVELTKEEGHVLDLIDLSMPPPTAAVAMMMVGHRPLPFTLTGLRELEADLEEGAAATSSSPLRWESTLLRLATQGLPRQAPTTELRKGSRPFLTWVLPCFGKGLGDDEGVDRSLSSLLWPLDVGQGVMVAEDGKALMVVGGVSSPPGQQGAVLVRLTSGITEVGLEGPPQLTLTSGSQSLLCEMQAACRRRLMQAHPAVPEGREGEGCHANSVRLLAAAAEGREERDKALKEVMSIIRGLEEQMEAANTGSPSAPPPTVAVHRIWDLMVRSVRVYETWSRDQGNGREARAVVLQ